MMRWCASGVVPVPTCDNRATPRPAARLERPMSMARRQFACRLIRCQRDCVVRCERQRQLEPIAFVYTTMAGCTRDWFPLRGNEWRGNVRSGTAPDGVLWWRLQLQGGIAIMPLEIGHDEVQRLMVAGAYLLDVRE